MQKHQVDTQSNFLVQLLILITSKCHAGIDTEYIRPEQYPSRAEQSYPCHLGPIKRWPIKPQCIIQVESRMHSASPSSISTEALMYTVSSRAVTFMLPRACAWFLICWKASSESFDARFLPILLHSRDKYVCTRQWIHAKGFLVRFTKLAAGIGTPRLFGLYQCIFNLIHMRNGSRNCIYRLHKVRDVFKPPIMTIVLEPVFIILIKRQHMVCW